MRSMAIWVSFNSSAQAAFLFLSLLLQFLDTRWRRSGGSCWRQRCWATQCHHSRFGSHGKGNGTPETWISRKTFQNVAQEFMGIFLGMGPEDKVQAGMTIPGLDFQGIFGLALASYLVFRWYFRSSRHWDWPEKTALFKTYSKKLPGLVFGTCV